MRRALSTFIVIGLGLGLGLGRIAAADPDDAPAQAVWRLEGRAHAGVPFVLDLVVDGFAESPAPESPKLDIAGARVTPLGAAAPNVSRSIQIFNGRRTEETHVSWVLRYRVEVDKDGSLHIPSVAVTQGSRHATSRAGDVSVDVIPVADDMKLELGLPDRPIFIGETAQATLTWLFRRDPADRPQFSVPAMNSDALTISAPPIPDKQKVITIATSGKDLDFPYTLDQTTIDGKQYNRLVVTFFIAPRASGTLQLPAASVVAGLAVGRPDFFGQAPSRLFRASDVARTLEVRPLPEQDKPATFSGAVGSQFSIAVSASRSVVQLGEPVELAVQIKSDQALDTLALPRLAGPGELPKDRFLVPDDPPTGELSDGGKTKTFKLTAQVVGPATEVPAIAFSYFDPKTRTYQTIKSDPIALSVKQGSVVGANDVVGATPLKRPGGGAGSAGAGASSEVSVAGAELALSSPSEADAAPLSGALLWLLVALLYAVPIALLVGRTWQLRTAGAREDAAEIRAARRRVDDAIAAAASKPARDTAGELAAALRGLARVAARDVASDTDATALLARVETESFAPESATRPLSAELVGASRSLAARWLADARRRPALPRAAVVGVVAALALGVAPQVARADQLDDGRTLYQQAMTQTDASARRATFARAAAALSAAAAAAPDHADLLTDWGNAALGAGDVATATLAYRRALVVDAGNARARHNLDWLRARIGEAFRPEAGGAADTLLFFHAWTRARRLVVGGIAFALAVLLLVPWSGRRRGWQIGVAIVPAIVWLAMLASVAFEDRRADDVVVMDGGVLRAADASGAPAAMAQPLPRGAEATIVEERAGWTKLRLPSGATGWVPGGTVQRVRG